MKNPVQDRGSDDRIPEDLIPLAEASIRGQDQSSLLVPPGNKLEEKMRSMPVDRNIAYLIDDEKLRLAIELQPFLDAVFGIGFCQMEKYLTFTVFREVISGVAWVK